jgi:hypothetical protein
MLIGHVKTPSTNAALHQRASSRSEPQQMGDNWQVGQLTALCANGGATDARMH